jgi:hypothetical protein
VIALVAPLATIHPRNWYSSTKSSFASPGAIDNPASIIRTTCESASAAQPGCQVRLNSSWEATGYSTAYPASRWWRTASTKTTSCLARNE